MKYYTTRELAKITGLSITAIERKVRSICKWRGIDPRDLIKPTRRGLMYLIPEDIAREIIEDRLRTKELKP